ncbi:MAG TPA: YsnF/AvaK domain-containing protein [Caldilineaceae bacterium]|nr:YsnF/AvaK domain-containing protein [Caldilineaceae bacterium]
MAKTAVGLYETQAEARQVVNELISSGFDRNTIHLMLGDIDTRQVYEWSDERTQAADAGRRWAENEAISMLVDSGVPRSDARYYQEALHQGNALVSVTTTDQRIDDAVSIMSSYGIIDMQDRIRNWGQTGATGATASAAASAGRELRTGEEEVIPVVEEELRVGKRAVERGGVRVRAHVTETPVEETVNLRQEHVDVERRPANRPVNAADIDALHDEVIEVSETGEEAVIDKQARVVEEVVVRKDVEDRQETVRDTVRHTDVDVERLGAGAAGWERFSNDFRTHFNTTYANSGYDYTLYEPAYRYGYTYGSRQDLRGRNWSEIEPEVRRRWEAENQGPWERFKDAIRHGWERATY